MRGKIISAAYSINHKIFLYLKIFQMLISLFLHLPSLLRQFVPIEQGLTRPMTMTVHQLLRVCPEIKMSNKQSLCGDGGDGSVMVPAWTRGTMTRLNVYFSEDELQEVQWGTKFNSFKQMSSCLDGLRGRYWRWCSGLLWRVLWHHVWGLLVNKLEDEI